MNFYRLLIVLSFFAFIQACTAPEPAKKSTPSASTTTKAPEPESSSIAPAVERDVLHFINKHRESKGLAPLTFNATVAALARKHSTDMASKKVPFGHQGLTNRTRSITTQMKSVTVVSENVARGAITAEQAVNLWLKSPGHKKNIEGNFKYTGIGVARDKRSQLYFTQIFAN